MNEDIPLKPLIGVLAISVAMLIVGEKFSSNDCSCGGSCRCSCGDICGLSCECELPECNRHDYKLLPSTSPGDEQNHNSNNDVE